MTGQNVAKAWRTAGIALAAVLMLTLGLYRHTVLYLNGHWTQWHGDYTHGYLVLAISGYLIIHNRKALSALMPCPELRALPAVAAAVLLWSVASLVDVELVQTVGLLLLLMALVWALLGSRIARVLLFPILFMSFAFPGWYPLSPLLQDITADVVFHAIRMIGVPVFRQENVFIMSSGRLAVEASCSGLNYVVAALTLGCLFAYMNYQSLRARVLVVLVSAGVAILANIVRVFTVVYVGYVTEMQHPLVRSHFMFGWYLFGAMVAILLFLEMRLHRYNHATATTGTIAEQATEQQTKPAVCETGTARGLSVLVFCAALVSAGPLAVSHLHQQAQVTAGNAGLEFPAGSSGWVGPVASSDDWMPVFNGAITLKQAYVKDGKQVDVYVGYYPVQSRSGELINYLNQISDGVVWNTEYTRPQSRQSGEREVLEQLLDNRAGGHLLVWYWYDVAGWYTTNEYEAKTLQVIGLLAGRRDAHVVAIATRNGDDADSARQILGEFASAMRPRFAQLQVVSDQVR